MRTIWNSLDMSVWPGRTASMLTRAEGGFDPTVWHLTERGGEVELTSEEMTSQCFEMGYQYVCLLEME